MILVIAVLIQPAASLRAAGGGAAKDALIGRNFIITEADSTNAAHPSVAYNTRADQHLVVWSDDRNMTRGSGMDLYGRLLGPDGAPLGQDFPITTAPFDQRDSLVAYNSGDDQYLVLWVDERHFLTSGLSLYGQRVDAEGKRIGGDFLIATKLESVTPRIVYNPVERHYLVAWAKAGRLYAQRIGGDGRLMGEQFIIPLAVQSYGTPSIAYNHAANQYLMTWATASGDILDRFYASHAQIVGADGRVLSSLTTIASVWRTPVGSPLGVYNSAANEYLVVYSAGVLYGRRMSADGRLLASAFRIAAQARYPVLTYNDSGQEYLVAWRDERHGSLGPLSLYAQRIGSDEKLIGESFAIADLPDYLALPQVNMVYRRAANRYLMVWQSRPPAASEIRIYGQNIDADGRLLGPALLVAPDPEPGIGLALVSKSAGAVAHNIRDNEYLVVWYETRNGQTGLYIYGRRLDADGRPMGDRFPIATAPGDQFSPAAVYAVYNDRDQRYLVAWSDARVSSNQLYGQIVDADGRLVGDEIPISTGPWYHQLAAVAYNRGDNEYLAVWLDSRARSGQIYGQRIGSEGELLSDDFPISSAPGYHGGAAVAYNPVAQEYLVVWADGRAAPTGPPRIYGQRVASDGRLLADNFPISAAPREQKGPAVAYNRTDNEYLVVWPDARVGTGAIEIYGQRVGADGDLLGDDFPIASTPYHEMLLAIAHNGRINEYVVVWDDERDRTLSYSDLYGQRLASDGRLIDGEFPVAVAPNFQSRPVLIYNRADNRHLVVWTDSRHSYLLNKDIYGQFLR